MDDECRGVRQRRKQADPTCCPVCGVTVRAHEIEQHYSMEMDRLNKLSVQKYRKTQPRDMPSTAAMVNSVSSPVASASSTAIDSVDSKDCWNTYQRIKNNRSARLKLKNRKRRADDPACPICNERIPDDINLHVELCLRRHERNNGNSSTTNNGDDEDDDDISIDVEGESYEEYEWAGQTRVRASSLLEGGYSAAGLQTTSTSQSSQNDEDEDLNVDGDDTQIYGAPQYSERDIILPMADNTKKENIYLRNLVIGESSDSIESNSKSNAQKPPEFDQNGMMSIETMKNGNETTEQPIASSSLENHPIAETEFMCEGSSSTMRKITIDLKDGSVKEVTLVAKNQPQAASLLQCDTAAKQIIESLKEKIREYEGIIKNKSKCLICMDEFRIPVVSICCWHVHCEECWLRTLGARKLCPQCNMITSPTDLRKIYM